MININDQNDVWQAAHVLDSTKTTLEFIERSLTGECLVFGQLGESSV